jgi:hypothetical protein
MPSGFPRFFWRPRTQHLFIHAGLHKTGTTAVQQAFSTGAAALRARGLLYPESGRHELLDGQHNLAWQIVGDGQFEPSRGGAEEVAQEIGRFGGDAILSSEDFETVLADPARLAPLLRHRALRRHRPTVVVYLRPQADYAESLYAEMLEHGLADDAAAFCDALLGAGVIRYRAWVFHFDYAVIAVAFAAMRGVRLELRPYRGLKGGSTITDLLHVTGRGDLTLPTAESAHNARDTLVDSLARFCAHRLGLDVAETEQRLGDLLGTALHGRRAALGAARRRAIRDRFAAGNRHVARAAGFPEASFEAQPEPAAGSLDMEALFSTRVLSALRAGLDGQLDRPGVLAEVLAGSGG